MRWLSLLFAFALLFAVVGCTSEKPSTPLQTIRINEVQSAGDAYDWIELYNAGTEAISLAGCYLTNDPIEPGKWQFPDITLEANAYLLLVADGVTEADDDMVHLPFRLKASGVSLRLSDHNGSILQDVTVPAGASGLSFGWNETSTTTSGYVWYADPTPGKINNTGMILGQETTIDSYGLRINEYMSRNRSVLYDENGDYSDWIELHNFSEVDIDLSGYTLTDARGKADKWTFPQNVCIPAGGYLLIRCSGRDVLTSGGELHTNFKLGTEDSFIGLYTAEGYFCSGINYKPTEQNISYGYFPDKGYIPCRLPTPGFANILSTTATVSEVTT